MIPTTPSNSEAAPRLATASAANATDKMAAPNSVSAGLSPPRVPAENAGRVGAYSSGTRSREASAMKPSLGNPIGSRETRHLNLNWSVAATDRVLNLARVERMTDLQIAKRMGSDVRREEIVRICADAGVTLRIDPR